MVLSVSICLAVVAMAGFGVMLYRTERDLREIDRAGERERIWYR
jgi:hypothetical protein